MTNDAAIQVDLALRDRAREDFHIFAMLAFAQLSDEPYLDNWHIAAIARRLEHIDRGNLKRLIISMPPRTMKSLLASVFYPAWALGRRPSAKIICASYAQPLSNDFALQMRRLMQKPWYKSVFPGLKLDHKKLAIDEIRTTAGVYRLSTSVGGVLTGRGADIIIIDDPIKAADAHSVVVRESVQKWYSQTVVSRLNNPKSGRIIIVAQRLHEDDLPGLLLQDPVWDRLILPLQEWAPRKIEILPGQYIDRAPGDVLHLARFGALEVASYRSTMGEHDFEAQYNQGPIPPGGALFKLDWLKRYEARPAPHQIQGIFQSWDTAYETDETNDYSACTTWALCGNNYYLLDVYRERLKFPDLQNQVVAMRKKWDAHLVVVERIGSGLSIHQNLTKGHSLHWLKSMKPEGSKQDRASKQTPKFERGEVWVPKEAPWLNAFEAELMGFPHSKFDDQVDSATQFLAAVDTGKLIEAARQAQRSISEGW
jgi:predicted phage terminase large subunit-like protein